MTKVRYHDIGRYKNEKLRKIEKSFALLICLLLLVTAFLSAITLTSAAGQGVATSAHFEEKEYWDGTIDEDFSGDSVMVVLDKYESGINKVHTADFFRRL